MLAFLQTSVVTPTSRTTSDNRLLNNAWSVTQGHSQIRKHSMLLKTVINAGLLSDVAVKVSEQKGNRSIGRSIQL